MPRKKLPPLRPLTEQQKKAVQLEYDSCWTVQEIADAVGVHRTTIWRWRKMREFWREWHRIDRNYRRKFQRIEIKRRAQEEAYWAAEEKKWKKKLAEESEKITTRPGKAWNNAYNNYMKACLHGRSLSDVMSRFSTGEYKPPRRRRHK